jgi:hypothetical protein
MTFLDRIHDTIRRLSAARPRLLPDDITLAQRVRVIARVSLANPWTRTLSVTSIPEGVDRMEDDEALPPLAFTSDKLYEAGRDLWWLLILRFTPDHPAPSALVLPKDASLYETLCESVSRVGTTQALTTGDLFLSTYALELARGAWGHHDADVLAIRELPTGVSHLDFGDSPRAYRPRRLFNVARELVWLQVLLLTT